MWQVEQGIFLLSLLWKVRGMSRVTTVIGVAMAIRMIFVQFQLIYYFSVHSQGTGLET